jgi:hypothetical protein
MESVIILAPKMRDTETLAMLGILNSALVNYLFQTRFLNAAVKGEYLKDLPLPPLTAQQTGQLGAIVDRILAAQRADAAADTSELEREVDAHVYALYGLTPDEIRLVEEFVLSSGRRAESAPDSPPFA